MSKNVRLLYGKDGIEVSLPDGAVILEGQHIEAIANPHEAVMAALRRPIASEGLAGLIARKRPRTVAITISDITRPVPNKQFLPAILEVLNGSGIADGQIVIIVGTGMHRHTTAQEMEILLGKEILSRIEVVDHDAHEASTLKKILDEPPVSVCRRFVEADFRIVTGYIEPHFMAGYSGGRKGVCPALVDLQTVQRFHGYKTLANPLADTGVLEGNPCHQISLKVAQLVGVDFLFNVAITRDRQIAGIYCGDMEQAHRQGCQEVAAWNTAILDGPFDLVVTNGGGFPLDQTFYQTVKGMCTALPALHGQSTLLIVSQCAEKFGSGAYTKLMQTYGRNWRGFLKDIATHPDRTDLDQWELQMQCRVLERIGVERLWFASDGMPADMQATAAVAPLLGDGDCAQRAQAAIDRFVASHPGARTAVIPDGPYTMLKN